MADPMIHATMRAIASANCLHDIRVPAGRHPKQYASVQVTYLRQVCEAAMSSAPPSSSNEPDHFGPGRADRKTTARDTAALADEISEAATAVANYIHAIKRLHTLGGRSEVGQIDLILEKTEEQLRRLRTFILALHKLAGIQSGEP